MSKRKKSRQRASSSARRRTSAASSTVSPRLHARKKPWLYTWGFLIVSAVMVIVLGASVLTFLSVR